MAYIPFRVAAVNEKTMWVLIEGLEHSPVRIDCLGPMPSSLTGTEGHIMGGRPNRDVGLHFKFDGQSRVGSVAELHAWIYLQPLFERRHRLGQEFTESLRQGIDDVEARIRAIHETMSDSDDYGPLQSVAVQIVARFPRGREVQLTSVVTPSIPVEGEAKDRFARLLSV